MPRCLLRVAAVAVAVLTLGASQASAGFSITLNTEFSGSGTPNYNVALMEWHDVSGGVLLTLTALVTNNEKITEFDFNLHDDHFKPGPHPNAGVAVTQQSGPTASIDVQMNHFKADGDGFFDVSLGFPTSGDTFGAGDVATFLISGVKEGDLNVKSKGSGNSKDGLFVAAHVQGIGATTGSDSGWYTGNPVPTEPPPPIPAPPSVILAGLGILGFGGWSRLRQRFALAA